jgi:hypothetical protein
MLLFDEVAIAAVDQLAAIHDTQILFDNFSFSGAPRCSFRSLNLILSSSFVFHPFSAVI